MKKKDELLASDATALRTPGMMLKSAREAKKLTVDDISQRILLRPRVIQELEDDNYSHVFARVYAEGYLKSYAKALGIAPDELLIALDRLIKEQHLYNEEQSVNEISPNSEDFSIKKVINQIPTKIWYLLFSLLSMGIFASIAVLWLYHHKVLTVSTVGQENTLPVPTDKVSL